MNNIRTFLTLLLAVILLAVAAAAKKPAGKITDLAAFSRIHSYCVDSSNLPGDEALDRGCSPCRSGEFEIIIYALTL